MRYLIAILVLCVAAAIGYPWLADHLAWRKAVEKHEDYQEQVYFEQNAEGRYVFLGENAALEEFMWDLAVDGYERYLLRRPNGAKADEARARLEAMRWARAVVLDSYEGYDGVPPGDKSIVAPAFSYGLWTILQEEHSKPNAAAHYFDADLLEQLHPRARLYEPCRRHSPIFAEIMQATPHCCCSVALLQSLVGNPPVAEGGRQGFKGFST